MFLSLTDFFSDESAAIQVDSSVINVSEFSDAEDQTFLVAQGHELLTIDAKADVAKAKINKLIDQKASDAKGKIIYDVQERFKNNSSLRGGLMRYFHSLGFWDSKMEKMGLEKPEKCNALSTAFKWANSYRGALEMREKLDGLMSPEEIQERVNSLPKSILGVAYSGLSSKDRETLYLSGEVPTALEMKEKIRQPEAQLSRAQDELQEAKTRAEKASEQWEEVKADPETSSYSQEYAAAKANAKATQNSIENWEAKIAELQRQVDAKEAELSKFKYDEDQQRQTRMKVLTDALTVGVPQATADLNKYIKDAEHYPADVRRHFDDQIKVLADMCGDYLSRI